MGIHTTDAIVLRQYPYRETSVLVTCLTDRFGKIKGLVKGLRVPMSRHRSPMEPLTLNRLIFYDTRASSLHLISQCDLLEAFVAIQRDLDVARMAAFCGELVDALLEPDEPHPDVFHLLNDTLVRLALAGQEARTIRIAFVLHVLRFAGFHPQLDECTGCGGHPTSRGFWSVAQGGLLCESCLPRDPNAEAVEPQWFERLAQYTNGGPRSFDSEQIMTMDRRLNDFLRWRVERPLKTMGNAECGMRNVR